jgi:peptide/nickel transport system permease protein
MSVTSLSRSQPSAQPSWFGRVRKSRTVRRFVANRIATAGALVVLALIAAAIFAPLLAPHDPNFQNVMVRFAGPGGDYLFGTDEYGRDVLSRLIFGARVSLKAGILAAAVAIVLGAPLGLLAGLGSRRVDRGLALVFDAIMSVPGIVFALAVITALGPGLTNAMLAIGFISSPRFFRLARASSTELKHETFIEATRSLGATKGRVLLRHVLPNVVPPLAIQVSFVVGSSILAEAALGFLGLGVTFPTASWGSMLNSAGKRMDVSHLIYPPTVALTLTVLAFSAVGDGWRDALGLDRREVSHDAS